MEYPTVRAQFGLRMRRRQQKSAPVSRDRESENSRSGSSTERSRMACFVALVRSCRRTGAGGRGSPSMSSSRISVGGVRQSCQGDRVVRLAGKPHKISRHQTPKCGRHQATDRGDCRVHLQVQCTLSSNDCKGAYADGIAHPQPNPLTTVRAFH